MPSLRDERPEDSKAVTELLGSAFGRDAEARLVDRLRAADRVVTALIAETKQRILGHVVFSRIALGDAENEMQGLALAPIAVVPAFQRLGVGSALVSAGLERCRAMGHTRVLVLGDPDYYSRFGFVPASEYGIESAFDAPPESFMALELVPGAFAGAAGVVRYGHEFEDLV
jgi:putative acetyltransferase